MPTLAEYRLATLDETGNVPLDQLGNAPSGGTSSSSLAGTVLTNVFQFGPLGTNAQDGTYQKLPAAGGGNKKVGDGSATTLTSVFSTLLAAGAVYSFASDLSQTVDFCAVQLALNVAATRSPVGYSVFVPDGEYIMGDPNNSRLSMPSPGANGQGALVGANATRGFADYGGVSRLRWTSDMVGGTAPHSVFAIDATAPAAAAVCNITLLGPSVFSFNAGRMPCRLAGLRVGGSSLVDNVSLAQFSTCVGMGGGTAYGFANTTGFDHSTIRRLWTNNCGYGIHLLPGSNTAGDQRFYDLQIAANCAGIAIAASASSGLTGSNIEGGGSYAPIGIYVYDDDTHAGGSQVLGVEFINFSFEQTYNCPIYFNRLQNPGGGSFAKNDIAYFPQQPHSNLNGWASPDITISSSTFGGGTPNQITVADNNGVNWQLGMTVTNSTATGVPAATTVTAINGLTTWTAIQAAWPFNNPTLTLSNNLTADPSGGTLTIVMPKLASVVAFSIRDITSPTYSAGGQYPNFYVPANGMIHDCKCDAVTETLASALLSPMTQGSTTGVTWGQRDGTAYFASGNMSGSVPCTAGDLLCQDPAATVNSTHPGTLKLFDGTSKPAGTAILTTSAGLNVDFAIRCKWTANLPWRNKSGSTIGAGALLYADATNAGGLTATQPSTGFTGPVGRNGASSVATGTSGTLAELWL